MRKKLAVIAFVVALSGCSKTANSGDMSLADRQADSAAGPDVTVSNAPGVALTYDYRFRLGAGSIAQVQEGHAQACEALGIAHCRISGMHYRSGSDPNDVDATLNLMLDPALARSFARDGITAVVKAGGKLAEAAIDSTDAGAAIQKIDAGASRLQATAGDIKAQLAALPPNAKERTALQERAQSIQEQIDALAEARANNQALLAITPVAYHYEPAQGWFGVESGGPFYRALETGLTSLSFALDAIIVVVGVGLPWVLLVLLARFLYLRVFLPLWRERTVQTEAEA